MLKTWLGNRWGKALLMALMLVSGLATAQAAEPTLNQVYEAAHAGKMDQAQLMMQQVLVAHPNSAKAHFVQAELSAAHGQIGRAKESLATADKLAPGLPFAKPEAVQKLRSQLNAPTSATAPGALAKTPSTPVAVPSVPTAPAPSFPWGVALAAAGLAVAALIYAAGKKRAAPAAHEGAGLSGVQTFGRDNPPAYGPMGDAQAGGFGQPAAGGLGGRVMGGLATGLAVGAGVMAAQALGKTLMGDGERPSHGGGTGAGGVADDGYQPFANRDLGGDNFGVQDTTSWDDGAASGGDWDS